MVELSQEQKNKRDEVKRQEAEKKMMAFLDEYEQLTKKHGFQFRATLYPTRTALLAKLDVVIYEEKPGKDVEK